MVSSASCFFGANYVGLAGVALVLLRASGRRAEQAQSGGRPDHMRRPRGVGRAILWRCIGEQDGRRCVPATPRAIIGRRQRSGSGRSRSAAGGVFQIFIRDQRLALSADKPLGISDGRWAGGRSGAVRQSGQLSPPPGGSPRSSASTRGIWYARPEEEQPERAELGRAAMAASPLSIAMAECVIAQRAVGRRLCRLGMLGR